MSEPVKPAKQYELQDGQLLASVKRYLRLDGSDDDDVMLAQMIAAAKQHLRSAGVPWPRYVPPEHTSMYVIAIALYVNTLFTGGDERLDRALDAHVLQIKDFGLGDEP